MTKIAIVGPGALGCVFAARLACGGARVFLVDHRADRAELLAREGVRVEEPDGTLLHEKPAIATQIPAGMDLVLVTVKAHATRSLRLPPDAPVLTLQNGLGNVDTLCGMIGSARVLAGATSEAATLLAPGSVRHAAAGATVFGSWTSCPADSALRAFQEAGFDARVTDTPGQVVWEKAAINAGINPLTALLNVPNGRLLEIPETRELLRDLVMEAAKVASTEGYRFTRSLPEAAEAMCRATSENLSSMLQDIRGGRRTEIEALSGEIFRRAQAAALPAPRTRFVYQLVKGLEGR